MYRRWMMQIALMCVGCGQASTQVADDPPKRVDTDFSRIAQVLTGIHKFADVLVYEGLPGDFWEPELREHELKRTPTIRMQGYPVYTEPLTVTSTDALVLTELLSAPGSFDSYNGGKNCGGYQLEYCVEWKTSGATTRALICLECGEVKFHAPQGELYCDISPGAALRLKELLSPYQKNRPMSEP